MDLLQDSYASSKILEFQALNILNFIIGPGKYWNTCVFLVLWLPRPKCPRCILISVHVKQAISELLLCNANLNLFLFCINLEANNIYPVLLQNKSF